MDAANLSNQQLAELLLTVDGRGVAVKRAALEELIKRAEQKAKAELEQERINDIIKAGQGINQ